MIEARLNREDQDSRSEPSELARALEAHYMSPSPITLGKLRESIEAISALCSNHSPDLRDLSKLVRDLGLQHLPVSSIEALVEACSRQSPNDAAGSYTLKQLEELLGRIDPQ